MVSAATTTITSDSPETRRGSLDNCAGHSNFGKARRGVACERGCEWNDGTFVYVCYSDDRTIHASSQARRCGILIISRPHESSVEQRAKEMMSSEANVYDSDRYDTDLWYSTIDLLMITASSARVAHQILHVLHMNHGDIPPKQRRVESTAIVTASMQNKTTRRRRTYY